MVLEALENDVRFIHLYEVELDFTRLKLREIATIINVNQIVKIARVNHQTVSSLLKKKALYLYDWMVNEGNSLALEKNEQAFVSQFEAENEVLIHKCSIIHMIDGSTIITSSPFDGLANLLWRVK